LSLDGGFVPQKRNPLLERVFEKIAGWTGYLKLPSNLPIKLMNINYHNNIQA